MFIPMFCIKTSDGLNGIVFGLAQFNMNKYGTEVYMFLRDSWINCDAITVFEYTKKAD